MEEQHCGVFFYADDGLVASADPEWMQVAFDAPTRLFDTVGLQTNIGNTDMIV